MQSRHQSGTERDDGRPPSAAQFKLVASYINVDGNDMRHFASDSAESYAVGVVDVARWEQFELGDTLPFQAMWYTVPPASSSPRDCHPEVELSVVVTGTASVETGGRITDVAPGSCFLLDSEEAHVIHNRSTDQPLFIFTTFWMPK